MLEVKDKLFLIIIAHGDDWKEKKLHFFNYTILYGSFTKCILFISCIIYLADI